MCDCSVSPQVFWRLQSDLCQVRASYTTVKLECHVGGPTKVPSQSVKRECPTRVSSKSVM